MKRFKYLFFTLLLICFSIQLWAQTETLKWYTLKEAMELNKKQPRKILIDMYTSWCGWCKKMDAETFHNPSIEAFIRDNYYAVKFDAETYDTIEFKDKKYTHEGTGYRTPHSLAVMLMNNKMSYPTIVYLDETLNPISAVPGYMNAADIEPVLIFFARNFYKIEPFENFKKDFEKTYKDTANFKDKINWMTLKNGMKTGKKKIIFLTYPGCIETNIMFKTSLQHDTIAAYLNKHFTCIQFDVLTKDTVEFNGMKYSFNPKENLVHQLAVALTNGQLSFPEMIFINEQNQLTSAVPGYFPVKNMEMLLHFFNNETYKTTKWEDYIKQFKSNIQ